MSSTVPIQDRVGLPTASNYQIDFFNAVDYAMSELLEGRIPKSLLLDAKPGSGKTTTGVAAIRLIPDVFSSIFVAFNKKIADELATRLPRGIPGKTLHSHWYRQWGRHCKNKHKMWPEVNNFKVRDAVDKHFGINHRKRRSRTETTEQKENRVAIETLIDNVIFLVEKAKLFGVVPKDYIDAKSINGMRDNTEFWEFLSEFFDHQIEEDELEYTIEIAREILTQGLDNELEVDFADMLYLPAVKRVVSERFMVVMVDEAQDLNELQHFLLGQMLDQVGVLICIGDRRQSIYGFAGASTESMDQLKTRFKCIELPLSISYRCARSIVDHAYQIYPEIEARPDAPEGSVEYPTRLDIDDIKVGDLIICRNNAPTVALAYRLIRNQIPAKVLGRDIGTGLKKLIRQLDDDGSLETMLEGLNRWKDRQITIADRKRKGSDRAKQRIRDRYDCISVLARADTINTVAELIAMIDLMFVSDTETTVVSPTRVTLSTIHKIKGAEADTVYFLDAHLINAPWMKGGDWQEIQETNLMFVGSTRAKTRLVFIHSDFIES